MPATLYTSRLIVRLATQEDIPAIVAHLVENRDFLVPFEPIRPSDFYDRSYWRQQVIRSYQQFQAGHALRLFIFERDAPKVVIGSINFNNFIHYPFYCCSLGYSIAELKQGQGLMREALTVSIVHVFNTMNCHRIQANYMPRNQRSGNLLKSLGFTVEGEAKDYLLIHGVWEDHVLTSLTNLNWTTRI